MIKPAQELTIYKLVSLKEQIQKEEVYSFDFSDISKIDFPSIQFLISVKKQALSDNKVFEISNIKEEIKEQLAFCNLSWYLLAQTNSQQTKNAQESEQIPQQNQTTNQDQGDQNG